MHIDSYNLIGGDRMNVENQDVYAPGDEGLGFAWGAVVSAAQKLRGEVRKKRAKKKARKRAKMEDGGDESLTEQLKRKADREIERYVAKKRARGEGAPEDIEARYAPSFVERVGGPSTLLIGGGIALLALVLLMRK